jgi:hypothetical protein
VLVGCGKEINTLQCSRMNAQMSSLLFVVSSIIDGLLHARRLHVADWTDVISRLGSDAACWPQSLSNGIEMLATTAK